MSANKYADYSYAAMSNLVTKADRRTLPKQAETTGEPESLAGRIDLASMGSRARTAVVRQQTDMPRRQKRSKKKSQTEADTSILQATAGLEGILYRPSTALNRSVFESLVSIVSSILGDQPQEIIVSASDLILEILKSNSSELDAKIDIERAIGVDVPQDDYTRLVNLSRKITDYGTNSAAPLESLDSGVAVIIDEDKNESDNEDEAEIDQEGSSDSESESDTNGSYDPSSSEEDFRMETLIESKNNFQKVHHIQATDIDAFWLQRLISAEYPVHIDAHVLQSKTSAVLDLIASPVSTSVLENDLMELFDFEKYSLVQNILNNRSKVLWCTRLARAETEAESNIVRSQIRQLGLLELLAEIEGEATVIPATKQVSQTAARSRLSRNAVDLNSLVFSQGSHLMSNKKVVLPEGSFKRTHASYEEVHVPAPKKAESSRIDLMAIDTLPDWARPAFKNTTNLNKIQSDMYSVAFGSNINILLCAPTGAGKTNVAMLCILHEVAKHRSSTSGIDLEAFKIVYIAPLKALVTEMVGNFSARLEQYGITVAELTGDSQLTRSQIHETQIIVTTPEKWDVITRKASDVSYTSLVRLLIIDEIHLLHDVRGPVLESIVSRVHRRTANQGTIRLVGLSATLPNYMDVARFLHVEQDKGLFFYDQTHRPCPLKQEYIGITEKKPVKRLQVMNTLCYEKMLESVSKQNQVLIFVHSRKETYKTAKSIRDQALENDTIQRILHSNAASREVLTREADNVHDGSLRELLPYGFAIHHAGLSKADRATAEDLFAEGYARVLVSTATLAWGVNLPAHTVIIKGTQVYSPEQGTWVELSPQDVLQMLGRAGRPQYDTYGEGIIITQQTELQFYLSLMNQQLPIESQFVSKLADNLNAEVVLGSVSTIEEAVIWLGTTYLYIRMLAAPALYKVGPVDSSDTTLVQKRIDLLHSAAMILSRCQLVNYNVQTGTLESTDLGRIASHYYITCASMKTYTTHLKSSAGLIELFKVFTLSEEFRYIPIREDEKLEVVKLLERVPVPVRESPDESLCKINVLLQAHIARMHLDGLALVADMIYVTQSASRIMRCIFEICLKKSWAHTTRIALTMCKMIERSLWSTRTPLAQFAECSNDLQRSLERKEFPWSRYFDLDVQEFAELIGSSKSARLVHQLVHQFPRLLLAATVQPISRSLLRVELCITPIFNWNDSIHGSSELFWLLVEDVDGEKILFHDRFLLKRCYSRDEHIMDFTLTIGNPIPPHYFVSLISDRWLHAECKVAISFRHMALPSRFPAPTPPLELQPISTSTIPSVPLDFAFLNPLQTQVFNSVFNHNENVLIAAPRGSGKNTCADIAIARQWAGVSNGLVLYIAPNQDMIAEQYALCSVRFQGFGKKMCSFTDDIAENISISQTADMIFATSAQWEQFSRRWHQRKAAQEVALLVVDNLHLVGGQTGGVLECAIARARYIAAQTETPMRIIALSLPLADPRDVADWLGIKGNNIYNFDSTVNTQLEIHLVGHDITSYPAFVLSIMKPVFLSIRSKNESQQLQIYVPDRKHCCDTAVNLIVMFVEASEGQASLLTSDNDLRRLHQKIEERTLREGVLYGLGYLHEALSPQDVEIVVELYTLRVIDKLIISRSCLHRFNLANDIVIIMGTQFYDGVQHRYVDYPDYYRKFLEEAMPIESQYSAYIYDNFISEISASTIESKQEAIDWLTWTFFYRRLASNPAYYGLENTDHDQLSTFLSDLVETTLQELAESKMIEIGDDDMTVHILNLGLIAAHYALSYISLQTFALSFTERTKLKGLLEIATSAAEFDDLPIRRHEEGVLRQIYDNMPVKLDINFGDPHHKAFILVQAHLSRVQLPQDLQGDLKIVLNHLMPILSACVDILSSQGFLNAISAIEISQMCAQAMWDRDSPLKQIPFFDDEVIRRCHEAKVEEVGQIADIDDAERNDILQMNAAQLSQVARFCNHYPDVTLAYQIMNQNRIVVNTTATLRVHLARERDDEDISNDISVIAAHFPRVLKEHWWIVLTDSTAILAVKKVTLQDSLTIKLEFIPLNIGQQSLTLSLFCDSYIGIDQEQEVNIKVHESEQPSDRDQE